MEEPKKIPKLPLGITKKLEKERRRRWLVPVGVVALFVGFGLLLWVRTLEPAWIPFKDPGGLFTVEFPDAPKLTSKRVETWTGTPTLVRTAFFATRYEDEFYGVDACEYDRDVPKESVEGLFEHATRSYVAMLGAVNPAMTPEVVKTTPWSLEGQPGREVVIATRGGTGTMVNRLVLVKDRHMVILRTGVHAHHHGENDRRFLESFKLAKGDLARAEEPRLPENPFARARAGDWATYALRTARRDGRPDVVVTYRTRSVEGDAVTMLAEARPGGTQTKTFSRVEAPALLEYLGLPGGRIEDVKVEEGATREISGRSFRGTKVTYRLKYDGGIEDAQTLWLSADVPCRGCVALESKNWSMELAGFGSDDAVAWGSKPDAIEVEPPADRFGDRPGLFRLRGVYRVHASAASEESLVVFPLPLDHGTQAPLSWEVATKPAGRIRTWRVVERKPGDLVAEVTLGPTKADDLFELEWESWVAIGPSSPPAPKKGVALAALDELPDEVKPWLRSTKCVPHDDERFRAIGKTLREGAKDVADLEERVLAKLHDVKAKQKGESKDLGALPALEKAGSCTSNANLCAALFRAAGVPARIVSGYAVWGGPHQTHYIVEAWLPGSGWVPFESTMDRARWPWSQQTNVSIVHPDDEDRSGLREGSMAGVPYASLTEVERGSEALWLEGILPGGPVPSCDHVATREVELAKDGDWAAPLAAARKLWAQWVSAAREGPASEEAQAARRPLRECRSLDALARALAPDSPGPR